MREVNERDARYWMKEVKEADCKGYLLPYEGAFVEIAKEMESACGEGCNKGSWHGAK